MTNRDQLILSNVDWARGLARERRSPAWLTDDLECAAMLGLCQAADRWDPASGVPFQKYAQRRVRGEVIDERRRQSHGPQHRGSAPDVVLSEATLKIDMRLFRAPRRTPRADVLDQLDAVLRFVDGKLRRVLMMMSGGMPGSEIAAVLGISESWVSYLWRRIGQRRDRG